MVREATITISGDGYLKLWDNSIKEGQTPDEHVKEVFVDKVGLHHIAVFEDTINSARVIVIAVTTFAGKVLFYQLEQPLNELKKLDLELKSKTTSGEQEDQLKGNPNYSVYWAIEFLKDPLNKDHKFVSTQANGFTKIHNFAATVSEEGHVSFELTYFGLVEPKSPSFAMSLAVSPENYLIATGFNNGDIIVSEVDKCRAVFTFHKPSISNESTGTTLSSSIRALRFSPNGNILAAAYDSGNSGNISLYDTKYGELIGNLTIPTHSASATININAHESWIFALDFNQDGDLLLSAGFDGKLRVWDIESREREATLTSSVSDFSSESAGRSLEGDLVGILDAKFIRKGVRASTGLATNDGIVTVGMDRGVRWYREAGGI